MIYDTIIQIDVPSIKRLQIANLKMAENDSWSTYSGWWFSIAMLNYQKVEDTIEDAYIFWSSSKYHACRAGWIEVN